MKVRTTQRPDVELDVEPSEYTDLARQGLLVDASLPKRAPERAELPQDVVATSEKES